MEQRSSAPARIAAAGALIAALVVAIVVIGSLGGGGDDSGGGNGRKHGGQAQQGQAQGEAPATYTIESGDTLTSIAHEVGVPVAQIQRLNPQVDPQILIAGEELKLR